MKTLIIVTACAMATTTSVLILSYRLYAINDGYRLERLSRTNFLRIEYAVLRYRDLHKSLPMDLMDLPEARADPSILVDPLGKEKGVAPPHYEVMQHGMYDMDVNAKPILLLNPRIFPDHHCLVGFDDGNVYDRYRNLWSEKSGE